MESDSAFEIETIAYDKTYDREFENLGDVLCLLPFSLCRKIDLRVINICYDIRMINPKYLKCYEKKVLGGYIPLSKC